MAANNIGIRHVPGIGVADIDVYDTNRRKYDKFPDKYAEKVKIRIGVFFDGTGNNSYNSDAVYYRQTLPLQEDDVPEVRHKGFEVENGASYWNPYTNIKLLHDLYEEKTKRDDSKNIIFQQIQLKVNDNSSLSTFVPRVAQEIDLACQASGYYWKNLGIKKVNINLIADKDDILTVSKEINGYKENNVVPNGYNDRVLFTNLLKEIFDYEKCKNNK
ncbi:MAG: hypothetical protein WCY77_11755 [Weeksellaceae bacterium]